MRTGDGWDIKADGRSPVCGYARLRKVLGNSHAATSFYHTFCQSLPMDWSP